MLVAVFDVLVGELAEVFDLWRDYQEPFVEDVEFVDVVEEADVLAYRLDRRPARGEFDGLLIPMPGEKLGVKEPAPKPPAKPRWPPCPPRAYALSPGTATKSARAAVKPMCLSIPLLLVRAARYNSSLRGQ